MNIFPLNLAENTDELKKLIAEHPDYPIVVIAGGNTIIEEGCSSYCSDVSFSVSEILDCEVPFESNHVCDDREYFKEQMEEWIWNEHNGKLSEDELFELEQKEIARYEPYWKEVIVIYADN